MLVAIFLFVLGRWIFIDSSPVFYMVGFFMLVGGFFAAFEFVPPGESPHIGDCELCGKTKQGVATMNGITYCRMCYVSGVSQAYFAGKDDQRRESESHDVAPTKPTSSGYSFAAASEAERESVAPAQPQVVREVLREKETIREVIKIRCPHCRTLYEESQGRCPHCGAPA